MEHSNNCILHYNSIKDDNQVVHIKSLSTWNSILEAARLRNYERILIISKDVIEGAFPTIQYHKACKTRFTLKRDIDTLKQEQEKLEEEIKQKEMLQQEQQQKEGCSREVYLRDPNFPNLQKTEENMKCYLLCVYFVKNQSILIILEKHLLFVLSSVQTKQ